MNIPKGIFNLGVDMKVQTGLKAGAHGGAEASHGGKPRPIGKGV
jgi:hypothetical protein